MSLASDRAAALRLVREFFHARNVMEVDTPVLSPYAPIDRHIDVMQVGDHYLHTSPEYAMKKLLCKGVGDIYQLSHVFRKGESGHLHSPEFMMLEWYRLGFTFDQMIAETVELIESIIGKRSWRRMTYDEALDQFATGSGPKELTWSDTVEPNLTAAIVTHFPASEAALAKTDGEYALRFEVYVDGIELANGYDELANEAELRRRFEKANVNNLPMDEELLSLLDDLPDCCGVAVGFDRLMMLRSGADSVNETYSVGTHLDKCTSS